MPRGELGKPRAALEVGERAAPRQSQREEREARRRAHRGEVAEVHGERAEADRAGCTNAPIEVDAFDQRVGREHLEAVALRLDDRRIVADADDDPGGAGGSSAGCAR